MLASPPPLSTSDLTPPPSTQVGARQHHAPLSESFVSPPSMPFASARPTPHTRHHHHHDGWKSGFPNAEEVAKMPEAQMREMLNEVIAALGDSRMSLAHTKLQLNLLQIETAEAAQRAEAEHDLTRREVEVLQAGSPEMRLRLTMQPDPRSPLAQVQRHLETTITHSQELEGDNAVLQRRLKQAKKVIKHLDGKNAQLVEDNRRLRDRIRQNREHFNGLRQPFPDAPATEPLLQRKSPSAATRSRNPLDALLMADQILHGEPTSLPTTPSPHRAIRYSGHTRGTHSLSSLPTTPLRSRHLTSDELLRTPVNQIISTSSYAPNFTAPARPTGSVEFMGQARDRPRHDRDSTISASEDEGDDDDEEALTDENLPASHASQTASHMLRRYSGPKTQEGSARGKQQRLVQKKLTGKATKGANTRKASQQVKGDAAPSRKKARVDKDNVGLGIGGWKE